MHNTHWKSTVPSALLCAVILLQACGRKATSSTAAKPIRGTVQSLNGELLTVATSAGPVRIHIVSSTPVATVVQSDLSHITTGSFLGIGSVKEPDGSLRAAEVTVFPESMRGTGEGNYAWNGPGVDSGGKMTNGTAGAMKMTNGTVSASRMTNGTVTGQAGGSALTLTYKDGTSQGTQAITIPPGVPVVTLEPGASSDLQPGAHVVVLASTKSGGELTAERVLAGKNGLVPPQ